MKTQPKHKQKTIEECFTDLDKAQRQGAVLTPDLIYQLSMALERGHHGMAHDHNRAVELCRMAAEAGHPLACTDMAALTPGFDSAESVDWLRRAVEAGDVTAKSFLGIKLFLDDENSQEARTLIADAVSRLEPHALSFVALGKIDGVENPDLRKARLYAAIALSQGSPELEPFIGRLFSGDDCREDGSLDFGPAIREAAEAGDPYGIYASLIIEDAIPAERTREQAESLMQQAADAGIPDAIESVAVKAINDRDYDLAAKLLAGPVDMCMPESMSARGLMYLVGDGGKRDVQLGISLISRSAAFGYAPAQMVLSELISRDPSLAGGLDADTASQLYSHLSTIDPAHDFES